MKYKDIHVYSHQRSGSHYFAALISLNFYNEQDYRKRYKNHPIGSKVRGRIDKNSDILFAYIFRNFNDTAKSMFKMRDRFGLTVDDYDVFLNTTYKDMWSSDVKFSIKINYFGEEKHVDKVSTYFKKINQTPREFWQAHKRFWTKMNKTRGNIIIVNYDDLINDFEKEIRRVGEKIGITKKQIINIDEKIGWIPVSFGEAK